MIGRTLLSLGTTVRARAPLRIGLAGGGTDIPSYYSMHGGCVLNVAIDRYAYATIEKSADSTVRFFAADLDRSSVFPSDLPLGGQGAFALHATVYSRMMDRFNGGERIPVTVATFCDAPPGSGLGSSSTLVVAMIRAFAEFLSVSLENHEVAEMAFRIERIDCGILGGKQDQFSASFGGVNFLEFRTNGRTVVNPLTIEDWILWELETRLVLFHTATSRESARIIRAQSDAIVRDDNDVLRAMHAIKREAITMKEHLISGRFDGIAESLRAGWESKKRSADVISNPFIETIYDTAVAAGAIAGKITGAGGGGFMLFMVPLHKRMDVIRALEAFDGQIDNCHFTTHGSQAWRV